MPRRCNESGQATAELALLLPVMLIIVLAVGQLVLIWRSQLLVTQAAREAARIGAVSADPSAIGDAARGASGLDPGRVEVIILERGAPGGLVVVRVQYFPVDRLPIVGAATGSVVVSATATMLVES